MISLLDVWERAQNGPRVNDKDWNMGLFHALTKLKEKYAIERKGDELINSDDSILDRAFEAAVEFLSNYGICCRDLQRVIHFSKQEILEAVIEAPNAINVGMGNERTMISQKKIGDKARRNLRCGGHAPFSLDMVPLVAKNLALHPRADYIEGFNFHEVEGRGITNPGVEVYAQIRTIEATRDGIRRAGKPGLAIALYPIHTRPTNMIATLGFENGLRPTDGILLSPLPDMKIESGFITTAIVCEQYGMRFRINGSNGFAGGSYTGSPENAIIESIAKTIASWMCYGDTVHLSSVEHTDQIAGERPVMEKVYWGSSVVLQTLNMKTNFITFRYACFVHELGTLESLKELSVWAVLGAVSGANIGDCRNYTPDINCGQTPLEIKLHVEIADGVIERGLTREEAGQLVSEWTRELHMRKPPEKVGTSITDLYDLARGRPKPDYEKKYEKIKEELVKRGLPLT